MDILNPPKRGRPFRTNKVRVVSAQLTIPECEYLQNLGAGNISKAIRLLVTRAMSDA